VTQHTETQFKCKNCGYIHEEIAPDKLAILAAIFCRGCSQDIKDQFISRIKKED